MLTILQLGQAEQIIKKSRFIAQAQRCDNERELAQFLRLFANTHPTAHHLVYAFRLNTNQGIVAKFSDASEPSGTAGKPILQMLNTQHYTNCCVAVVRYYGDINLGKGGLARAYCGTAKLAIQQAQTIAFVEMINVQISITLARVDEFTREISKLQGVIIKRQFDQQAHFAIRLPASQLSSIQSKYTR